MQLYIIKLIAWLANNCNSGEVSFPGANVETYLSIVYCMMNEVCKLHLGALNILNQFSYRSFNK